MNQVTYLSRDAWGGGPVNSGHSVPLEQFIGIVVHHTVIVMPDYDHDGMVDGDIDDIIRYMRTLQHARPDLGDEVPYSFVGFRGKEAGDVIVAEGRGFGVTGAHTIGYNSTRYGYAFAGDFTNVAPTPGMWDGVTWIGAQLRDPKNAVPTLEHRDVYATQCPGNSTPRTAPSQPPFVIDTGEEPMQFHYARLVEDPTVYLVNIATKPRPVVLFGDVDYWAALEGHTVKEIGDDVLGPDGATPKPQTRKGILIQRDDLRARKLFGFMGW